MVFFKMILSSLIFILFCSKICETTQSDKKILVENSKIIACDSTHCQIVKSFMTSENNSFGCHEENILITFQVNIDNETVNSFGYLTQGGRGFVETKQFSSNVCKKIKKWASFFTINHSTFYNLFFNITRYYVNEEKEIIIIDDFIKLIDIENEYDFIWSYLLKNFQFLRFFLFAFQIYDFENNHILFYKASKVIFWFVFKNIITFLIFIN